MPQTKHIGLPHFASKHPLSDHQFISSHGDFFLAKSLDGTHQGEKTSPWQSHRHPWRPWRQNESLNPWTNGSPAPFWHKQCIIREKLYCIFPIFIRITVRCDIFLCLLSPVGKRSAAVNAVVSLHLPIDIESTAKWSAPSSMSRSTTWCTLKTWDHGSWPKKCMPGRNCTKCMISRCDLESCLV